MAAGFSITIGAVDRASGILAQVNKNLAAMQAPAKNFAKQVSKFSELSGLRKVSQGFDGIVRSTLGAARGITRVAEPMAAITGAASIAGFTTLISKWAEFQTTLGFAAQRMGVMPQMLGALRASGALAGGSADAMQTGFENLGQTLYDMANGQAPQAAYVMSRLGISLLDATGHARKAQDVMPRLADAIAGIKDPLAQARLATMLFGAAGIDMLPVLRQGSRGMEELQERARKYGGTTNEGAAAALQFSQAQAAVSQSVVGLTDAIETQLAPVISPLLLQLADWISKGRTSQFVTHDLGQGVKDFAAWLKAIDFSKVLADVKTFGGEVASVLEKLDAWRKTLESITGKDTKSPVGYQGDVREQHPTMLGRFMYDHFDRLREPDNFLHGQAGSSQVSTLGSKEQAARAAQAMAVFQLLGWTRAQAAGLAANIQRESGFNPGAVGDNGTAAGLGQWHPDRQANFAKWAGFGITDPRATFEKQLQFYSYELTGGTEQAAGRALRATQGAGDSGATVSLMDERPGNAIGEAGLRGRMADALFNTAAAGPEASPAGSVGSTGAAGATGRVDVNIIPPPGAKVTARSTGNVNTPRIATAMPAAGPSLEMGGLY